ATGKRAGLKMSDLDQPKVRDFLSGVEQSVVHYGSSTGFFGRKMFTSGPEYLSAAVLYESMVVESYSNKDMPFPVVAIYPKEGTFVKRSSGGRNRSPWGNAGASGGGKNLHPVPARTATAGKSAQVWVSSRRT